MKILNVNHLLDPVSGGGTAERNFQLSRALVRAGAECRLACLDIGITPERLAALGDVETVRIPCLNHRYFLPGITPARFDALVSEVDVVHLSGHWTVLNALAYRSCLRTKKPFVFCPAGALKRFGRSLRLKSVYDALVGKRLVRSAAACVAITADEGEDFAGYGIPPERIEVIPNGIDPAGYEIGGAAGVAADFRRRFGLGEAPYILFLGRLNGIKGPDLLLEAFASVVARYPALHLVFAGPDGGMLSALREECARRALAGRVHFAGYVGGPEKIGALNGAALLAIPSRFEAMSIVVLEAGISKVPVLFTHACGLAEIAQSDAGIAVEASPKALAGGLANILDDARSARERADRLHGIVRSRYLWDALAQDYLALYSRVLAETKGKRT